jgi:hypothetical protein
MMLRDPLSELGGWLSLTALMALFLIWYVRRWHTRKQKFWAPLAPIVNGDARGYRMVGTYERHAVVAEISPVSDTGPRSPNNSPWFFSTALDTVPGRNRGSAAVPCSILRASIGRCATSKMTVGGS